MSVIVALVITLLSLVVRSRLSVENPGKLQIVLEDLVGFVIGILREYIGPEGRRIPAAHRHRRALHLPRPT